MAEQGEDHAANGIEHQDIPAPEECDVHQADQQQDGHPPVEGLELSFRIGQLDAEAHAEQQGEQRVEFPVDEHRLEGAGNPVGAGPGGRIGEGP